MSNNFEGWNRKLHVRNMGNNYALRVMRQQPPEGGSGWGSYSVEDYATSEEQPS